MKVIQRLQNRDAQRIAVGGIVSILVIAALGFALFPLFSSQRDLIGFAGEEVKCTDTTFTGGGCTASTLNSYYICSTVQYCHQGVLLSCSGNTCATPPPQSTCNNNNAVDAGEQCDGTSFGTYGTGIVQCSTYSSKYTSGTLSCSACKIVESACSATSVAVCGNGVPETGEQCDDGNTASGDGCSATCTLVGAGTADTRLSAAHQEPVKTLRQAYPINGLATAKEWLVFASQSPPTFTTGQLFAESIVGEKLEAEDGVTLTNTHAKQYETWVTSLYKDGTVTDTFRIVGAVDAYLDGARITNLQSFTFQPGWNILVVVVDTQASGWSSWGFHVVTSGSGQAVALGSKVPLLTNFNFDYNNDGKLQELFTPPGDIDAYADAGGSLENQEILRCIVVKSPLDFYAYKQGPTPTRHCALASEVLANP